MSFQKVIFSLEEELQSFCPKGFFFCFKKIIQRKEEKKIIRGGDDRTRTDDFMRAKHAFYQLNYTPLSFLMQICAKKLKSGTYLKKKSNDCNPSSFKKITRQKITSALNAPTGHKDKGFSFQRVLSLKGSLLSGILFSCSCMRTLGC